MSVHAQLVYPSPTIPQVRRKIITGLEKSVTEYESTKEFFEGLSTYTAPPYKSSLNSLFGFLNSTRPEDAKITPDDVIKLSKDELKGTLFQYVRYLRKVAKPHAGKQVKGEISVNSVPNMMTGVKSWLEHNEIELPWWKKLEKLYPEKVNNNLRGYYREEIATMVELADPFDAPIVCVQKCAGPRVGGLDGTLIENVLRLPEGMGLLSVYPDSQKYHYTVPLDPETMFYIDASLEYRRMHGETITPKSPLFRDKFVPGGWNTNRAKAIDRQTIRDRIKRLAKKAGVPLDVIQPDHSFRYFFDTCMMNSECKWEIKELMMGHSVKLEKFYYDKKNPESQKKLIIEYMKGMDSLVITPRFKMQKRIAQLEQEVKDSPDARALQTLVVQQQTQLHATQAELERTRRELAARPTLDQVRELFIKEYKGDYETKLTEK